MTLSRTEWIEAAYEVLRSDGLRAVAVEPLAQRLGTTKGSFYWHFSSRRELVTATLDLWEQRETTEVIARLRTVPTPRERLIALGTAAYSSAAAGNAHAAVLAAASDPLVAPVLARVTRARLQFLTDLYRDVGLPGPEAARVGRVAYALYLGVGALRQADSEGEREPSEDEAFIRAAVEVMLAPTTAPKIRSGSIPA